MSQAKVDKYKKEKANRQKIMKKQKWMHRFEMTGIALVAVLVVGYSSKDCSICCVCGGSGMDRLFGVR